MVGLTCRAFRKVCRIAFSDSPTHFERAAVAPDRDEVRVRLVGDRLRHQRLPGAGRAVQQHALRGSTPIRSNFSGELSGHSTDSLNLLLGLTEPTDVVPRYLRELDEDLAHRGGLHLI